MSLCVCEYVFEFKYVFLFVCERVFVCALREKQLIIEFNRRNTVYPERHKASERDTERERERELGGSRGR